MTLEEARDDLLAQDNYDPSLYKGREFDAEGNQVEEAGGLNALINNALVWWAKMTLCCEDDNIELILTVNQTTPYNCRDLTVVSKKVLKPRAVVINSTTLYRFDGKQYGLWTQNELQRVYPSWRTADAKQPSVAIWKADGSLRLWPKTDALYTGLNFIEGWYIPSEQTTDGTELPVPEEDHAAIVRLALDYGTLPQAEDSKGQRMFRNENWWREQAQRRRAENTNAYLGRRPRGERASEWLY